MAASLVRTAVSTLGRQTVNKTLRIPYRNVWGQPIMAFTEAQIIPDVVRDAPIQTVKVDFPSGVSAEMGNTLTPTQVKDPPTLVWQQLKKDFGKLYTVLLTDPDAPSRDDPKWAEWHHWLVVNVPLIGDLQDAQADMEKGEVLADYIGSGPPEGTGLHRYVYLVFEQKGKISDKEHGKLTNTSADGRGGFSTKKFMQKHGLEKPLAGNFYYAEFDDYVPKLYKQLGAA